METIIEKGSAKISFLSSELYSDNPNMIRVRFAGTEKDLLTSFSFIYDPDDRKLDLCVAVNEKYKPENCIPRSKVLGTDCITLCQGSLSEIDNVWKQGIIPQIEKAKFNVAAVFNHSEEYLNEIVKKAQKKAIEASPDFQKKIQIQQAQIQQEYAQRIVRR